MAESKKSFARRVKSLTGVALGDIPQGTESDLLGGRIECRRGDTYVVTHGYPDSSDRESGEEGWDPRPENFRVVTISQ